MVLFEFMGEGFRCERSLQKQEGMHCVQPRHTPCILIQYVTMSVQRSDLISLLNWTKPTGENSV